MLYLLRIVQQETLNVSHAWVHGLSAEDACIEAYIRNTDKSVVIEPVLKNGKPMQQRLSYSKGMSLYMPTKQGKGSL